MKKTFYISIIFLFAVLIWNCKEKSDSNSGNEGNIKKDSLIQDSISQSAKTKLTRYSKKWIQYVDENGLKTSEWELYISEHGDTISWNKKIYKNGILDLSQSNFYEFDAKMTKDSMIKGRITLFSNMDYSIKDPVVERELSVDFVNHLSNKKKVITFESKNKNYVDFEFKNNNDTIVGLLTEYRRIDLIKNPDSTRMIWTKLPIDSKSSTNNIFINVHKLDKNKR